MGKQGKQWETLFFFWLKIIADGDCSHEIKRHLLFGRKTMTNLDSILKSRDITLPTKGHLKSYDFSRSHVWMWELDYKESWALKNQCFWTVLLEKTLESPLDWKEVHPVHPKGNKSWISIGRTDAEAETPILWPLDVKNWLIEKDPDAGKDWRQEGKRMPEDKMVGWHHQLDGHGFKQAPEVGDGQKSLLCCRPWGRKDSVVTEWLNWTEYLGLKYASSCSDWNMLSSFSKYVCWTERQWLLSSVLGITKEKYPKTIITENIWRFHSQDPLNQESANTFCKRVDSKYFGLWMPCLCHNYSTLAL